LHAGYKIAIRFFSSSNKGLMVLKLSISLFNMKGIISNCIFSRAMRSISVDCFITMFNPVRCIIQSLTGCIGHPGEDTGADSQQQNK